MAQEENEVSSCSSTKDCSSSASNKCPDDTFLLMKREFDVIRKGYAKLRLENEQLVTEKEKFNSILDENKELTLKVSQFKKDIISLKEEVKRKETEEQKLREVLENFNKSSKKLDEL